MKPILLLSVLITSTLVAQEPDSASALFGMREAERNFAKSSCMIGRNAAFAEYFAEKSVIFTNKWITNGKQFSAQSKPSPVVLKWEPEYMDISGSRDFGISTGPWEAQEYRPNTQPLARGYFLTVWKKQKDGTWKVILDGGSDTPAPEGPAHAFSFPAGADKAVVNPPNMNPDSLSDELLKRENKIINLWQKNPVTSVYLSFLGPNARMQVNGHLPTTNRDTVSTWISSLDKTLLRRSSGCEVASSGDLGFTYGVFENSASPNVTKGHYVRIWRKQPDSKWLIVLEMMNMH
jgi:ketosteroid isomerase-like protein